MSDNSSFIDEVTDEVRRDRMNALLRRWGPFALAIVVLAVGAAAVVEWQRARDRDAARAFGDAVLAALAEDEPEARRAALLDIEGAGAQRALLAMLAADTLDSDTREIAERLGALAEDTEIPPLYRDLAALKGAMIEQGTTPPADLIARLEPLTSPGAPFRLLALEQLALAHIAAGDRETALRQLQTILEDGLVTRDLQARARQLIVALGGSLDAA